MDHMDALGILAMVAIQYSGSDDHCLLCRPGEVNLFFR